MISVLNLLFKILSKSLPCVSSSEIGLKFLVCKPWSFGICIMSAILKKSGKYPADMVMLKIVSR